MNWNSFVSTLIGAMVSFGAILFTNWLDLRKRRDSHAKLIRALMQGLQDEIAGLLELSKSGLADLATIADGKALETVSSVSQDYFTVYHANAALVMQIEDDELRRTIIQTYTRAKSVLDTFRINQIYLERLHYLQSTFHKTKEPSVQAAAEEYNRALVKIAAELKRSLMEFNTTATRLLQMLADNIKSAPN
jgi:hypothetical protein